MPYRKKQHTHQYRRTYPFGHAVGPLGKIRAQWECALPDCTHYLPTNMAEPVGKFSLCNRCMEIMQLTEENMKEDKPICEVCSNPDRITIPADVDWERLEAKSFIHGKTGKPFDEITEEEIDKMVGLRRLNFSGGK